MDHVVRVTVAGVPTTQVEEIERYVSYLLRCGSSRERLRATSLEWDPFTDALLVRLRGDPVEASKLALRLRQAYPHLDVVREGGGG